LQIPIGRYGSFRGVVDLLDMKAVVYDITGDGKEFSELSLLDAGAAGEFEDAGVKQDALLAEAQEARDKLVEEVGELDDEVLTPNTPTS
jgi:elongation factor G